MIAANDNRLTGKITSDHRIVATGPWPHRLEVGRWYPIALDGPCPATQPANSNRPPLSPAEREIMVESILEEFDLLSLGIPTPERIEREIAIRTLH